MSNLIELDLFFVAGPATSSRRLKIIVADSPMPVISCNQFRRVRRERVTPTSVNVSHSERGFKSYKAGWFIRELQK